MSAGRLFSRQGGSRLLAVGAALLTLALGLPSAGQALATELGVSPVTLQFDRLRNRGTVQVLNLGAEPVTVQADAVAWRREAGRDIDEPTQDLLLNPPIFTIPPGQSQVVRVGLRRPVDEERETLYRLVLRELPPAPGTGPQVSAQVRVLMALRLPVYVAPASIRRDARWTALHTADGQVVAEIHNQGNVHLRLAHLRLLGADTAAPLAERHGGAVLLPGEKLRVVLDVPNAATPRTLEVQHDQGTQHVAVSPPR